MSSVKVVRHKNGIFVRRGCGKKGGGEKVEIHFY
jgi:hypothetical protein